MAVNRAKFLFSCTKNVLFLQHALLCLSCSQEAHENANPLQRATQIWRNDLIAASRPTAISSIHNVLSDKISGRHFLSHDLMARLHRLGALPESSSTGVICRILFYLLFRHLVHDRLRADSFLSFLCTPYSNRIRGCDELLRTVAVVSFYA